ncbi:hypothetical protein PHISCL_02735 [Aspergillus sclerotialis]|uniref:Zn(2)-C6 fungal-type domain-containing protein n=1 Tax=Aspergillus sclerotialis TaxID=2070753 RepID=A0A3A2ZRF3_9EURO|nr:hypothetical protein PHISCL_02735 [Aspergillus sclerotialis]
MATVASRETRGARTRSFGGCTTCRSRHVKCDEGRPTCAMCHYFGLVCGGYGKDLFFDSSERAGRFRRPLLTEKERENMCQRLVSSVPAQSTQHLLTQIDEACEKAAGGQEIQLHCGPFGVFRASQLPRADSPCTAIIDPLLESRDQRSNSPPQGLTGICDDLTIPLDAPHSPNNQQLIWPVPENHSEQIPNLPSLPPWNNMEIDLDHIEEVIGGASFMQSADLNHFVPPPIPAPSITNNIHSLPHNATILIKHYSTTVIGLMTPLRHTKTPWHVLFIPHAKNCLSGLTLCENLNHASLTAFYGTLAISAISLGGLSKADIWFQQGRKYKQRAAHHARHMLETAYDVPKTAKYKSILIALLTMVYVSMFSDNGDQTEFYFLQTEKFIRLRGLHRRKSRKVRLLHHCYAFERLVYESTFVGDVNSTQRHHVRSSVESSGLIHYSQDSLSFRLPRCINLAVEMLRARNREEAENDLHIERSGIWNATLYPEIFGISESWIFLLSRVIRLGRERDASEGSDLPNPLTVKEFVTQAKAIEKEINNLQRPDLSSIQSQDDQQHVGNMFDAMKYALAIYFYRKIYDLEAHMLQIMVLQVRNCLLQCESVGPNVLYGSTGYIWPAFIAACETADPEIQLSFSNWFKTSAQRSGLSTFTDTLANIERIWDEKGSVDGVSMTWHDLVK